MSHRFRRSLAAMGMAAALTLALPAPSHAAGLWAAPAAADLTARVWSWLESLGLAPRPPAAASRRPLARWEKQGNMVDPNGQPLPASTTPDQGSGIDPNGGK
jgi:hypothetical protein